MNNRGIDSSATGPTAVVGPTGSSLTLADLPPSNTRRWVSRRKAEVVAAVRQGLLTLGDACKRYNLTEEEFLSWSRLVDRHGMRGLRTTRLQDYRKRDRFEPAAAGD
ncbi:MAG: DUF1153 domain-containing protein [Alphaproteobacteria bacterium]|jgi:hypothetical protein|nr:DUF1153 domain-containing protein [Alphaproteobacteria bacterium]